MNEDDDDFFADDDPVVSAAGSEEAPWRVLVVDDEPSVHDVTRLALRDFSYRGRGVELLRADSAEEARARVDEAPDVALILLDVVMESDHAGLDFARWLREERGLSEPRIILRTGQPGQAPERQVVLAYDINDYKAKSELTADRLFTCVVAALRGYHDILSNIRLREEFLARMEAQARIEQALMDMLPLPVVQIDAMGQIAGANEPLAALCQDVNDADSLIGRPAATVLPEPLVAALAEEGAREPLRLGASRYNVMLHRIPDGAGAELGALIALVPLDGAG